MPLVLVVDPRSGGAARILAPIYRSGLPHEVFDDPDAALNHVLDPFFRLEAHVIVIGPLPQARLLPWLETIETHRPTAGSRIILLTEAPGDDALSALAGRLGVHAVLHVPFGVEELGDAITRCAAGKGDMTVAPAQQTRAHTLV